MAYFWGVDDVFTASFVTSDQGKPKF